MANTVPTLELPPLYVEAPTRPRRALLHALLPQNTLSQAQPFENGRPRARARRRTRGGIGTNYHTMVPTVTIHTAYTGTKGSASRRQRGGVRWSSDEIKGFYLAHRRAQARDLQIATRSSRRRRARAAITRPIDHPSRIFFLLVRRRRTCNHHLVAPRLTLPRAARWHSSASSSRSRFTGAVSAKCKRPPSSRQSDCCIASSSALHR